MSVLCEEFVDIHLLEFVCVSYGSYGSVDVYGNSAIGSLNL